MKVSQLPIMRNVMIQTSPLLARASASKPYICPTSAGGNSQLLTGRRAGLQKRFVVPRSAGSDAVQGWIDVAKLVSGGGSVKSAYKDLAYQIGKDIYIDINGWHLFLKDITAAPDVKLNQALAQQIGEESNQGKLDLESLLKKIPIKIGGGKTKVSLFDAIPSFGYDDLKELVKDFERN